MNGARLVRAVVRAPAFVGFVVSFVMLMGVILLLIIVALVALFFRRAAGIKEVQEL